MNITFLTTRPLQSEPVIANRLIPFIEVGLSEGYSVTLVSPDHCILDQITNTKFTHILVQEPSIRKTGFLARSIHEAVLSWRVMNRARKLDDKCVFITIPSMFLIFCGFYLWNRTLSLDVRDLTWEYLSDSHIATRYAKRFFRFCFSRVVHLFEIICVTNDTEYEYVSNIRKNHFPNLIKVSNGVSKIQFDAISRISAIREANNRPIVVYIGNIGIAQNLTTLMRAAIYLKEVQFEIVGGGTSYDEILELREELGLKNVNIHGRLSWVLIPKFYASADILYAQLSSEFSGAMPSKLYEYLATGKRIIYGGYGQAPVTLAQFENLTIIEPDDVKALVHAIKGAIGESGLHRISYKNRELIEKHFVRENSVLNFYKRMSLVKIADDG